MRLLTSVCFLLLLSGQCTAACNYIQMVRCFMETLGDWAYALYEAQDNVVTIGDAGCEHFKKIGVCIRDMEPVKHNCNLAEILETSRTVSDLLTHRQGSGTFLKSYYLLEYSCVEARDEVNANKQCLEKEHIGAATLLAATYLEDKIQHVSKENGSACTMLSGRLDAFRKTLGTVTCNGVAARLMCESLLRMFKNVDPDKLGSCSYNCEQTEETAEPEMTREQGTPNALPEKEATGTNGRSSHLRSPAALLLLATLYCFYLFVG